MEAESNVKKTDFICVGAPKCGTTWIYKCLEEHPQICMGKPKEIHFFNKYHGNESTNEPWHYPEGMGAYFKHFDHCKPGSIIGEIGPKYLYSDEACTLIKQHFPEVKIFMCLRHPADRAYSHYNHLKSKGVIKDEKFEDMLDHPDILNWSLYADHVERYTNHFSKEKIRVLFYDDLKKDPSNFMLNIYDFTGVDCDYVPANLNIKVNSAQTRFSKSKKGIMRYLQKIYITTRKIPVIGTVVKFFRKKNVQVSLEKGINQITSQEKNKYELDHDTRARITEKYFRSDIEKLKKILPEAGINW